MTGLLAERFGSFAGLEIDRRAVDYLREKHPGVTVWHLNVLEVDWKALSDELGGPLYVIGNLPYNITSPILFRLLQSSGAVREAVLLMQREVAERIVAVPRTKAYGAPSVLLQLYARPELLFRVSRNVFIPKPAVESAVLRLGFDRPEPSVDRVHLTAIVRAAFSTRRKMLRNCLTAWTKRGADLPGGVGKRRAEELSPASFVELARIPATDRRASMPMTAHYMPGADTAPSELDERFVEAISAVVLGGQRDKALHLAGELHPADLARLIGHLPRQEARVLFRWLPAIVAADVLEDLDDAPGRRAP